MSKLNKDLKDVITDAVVHKLSTKKSKKSSFQMVAKGERFVTTIVVSRVTL